MNPDLIPYALGRATMLLFVAAALLVPGVILLRRPLPAPPSSPAPATDSGDAPPPPKVPARSQPRKWGTALLIVGALVLVVAMTRMIADIRVPAASSSGASSSSRPTPLPLADAFPVGDCTTYAEYAAPKPRIVASDCADARSVLELAAITTTGECPTNSTGAYYVTLTTTTTNRTYCFALNLLTGRCYREVGEKQKAVDLVPCSDYRRAIMVIKRTETSDMDPAGCSGPGLVVVNYEIPPRSYCVQLRD